MVSVRGVPSLPALLVVWVITVCSQSAACRGPFLLQKLIKLTLWKKHSTMPTASQVPSAVRLLPPPPRHRSRLSLLRCESRCCLGQMKESRWSRFRFQIQIWWVGPSTRTFLPDEKAERGFYGAGLLSFDLILQCKSKLDQSGIVWWTNYAVIVLV